MVVILTSFLGSRMEPGKNSVHPHGPQVFTIMKQNMYNTPLHQASKHDLKLSKHNQGTNSGLHLMQTESVHHHCCYWYLGTNINRSGT